MGFDVLGQGKQLRQPLHLHCLVISPVLGGLTGNLVSGGGKTYSIYNLLLIVFVHIPIRLVRHLFSALASSVSVSASVCVCVCVCVCVVCVCSVCVCVCVCVPVRRVRVCVCVCVCARA